MSDFHNRCCCIIIISTFSICLFIKRTYSGLGSFPHFQLLLLLYLYSGVCAAGITAESAGFLVSLNSKSGVSSSRTGPPAQAVGWRENSRPAKDMFFCLCCLGGVYFCRHVFFSYKMQRYWNMWRSFIYIPCKEHLKIKSKFLFVPVEQKLVKNLVFIFWDLKNIRYFLFPNFNLSSNIVCYEKVELD